MKNSKIKKTCGMCLGLDTPYYGKSCRERLGKKAKSKICSDFAPREMRWDDIRKRDTFLKKLNKKVKYFKIDKSLLNELQLYYLASYREGDKEIRSIPTIINKKSMNKLVGLFEQNQAYKDRVVQIETSLMKDQRRLERLKSTAEAYLYKTYGRMLAELKSADIRRTMIDDILRPIVKKLDDFETISDTAGLVKENLHNTHFVLTNIKDLAEHFFREIIKV